MAEAVMMRGGAYLPSFISGIDGGQFTVEENVSSKTIYHKLGQVPKGFVCYDSVIKENTSNYNFDLPNAFIEYLCIRTKNSSNYHVSYPAPIACVSDSSGAFKEGRWDTTFHTGGTFTNEQITFSFATAKGSMIPGRTYNWIAWC